MRRRRVWTDPGAGASDLLSVAQSLGAVLLFDMYTPSAYATSGSNVVSVTNRITDVVHNWGGGINPPVFNATGLNGGPCWVGDGTDDKQFVGTEAAVRAILANNTPNEVFAVCSFDVADANGYIFGANGEVSFLRYGQSSTGAGRWHMRVVNNSSTNFTAETTIDYPADTNPHLFNFRRADVASLYVDQAVTSINNTAQDATVGGTQSMTFDSYRWGHYQSTGAGEISGKASLLIITPALDSTQRDALIAAIAAHHPTLDSLINP